jgi:hypothetical protein
MTYPYDNSQCNLWRQKTPLSQEQFLPSRVDRKVPLMTNSCFLAKEQEIGNKRFIIIYHLGFHPDSTNYGGKREWNETT